MDIKNLFNIKGKKKPAQVQEGEKKSENEAPLKENAEKKDINALIKDLPEPQKPQVTNPIEALEQGMHPIDIIAPEYIEADFSYLQINDIFFRTLYVSGYPRFVSPGWMDPIINFDHSLDITYFIYPVEGQQILTELRRKITEMEAELSTDLQRGKILDPATEAKLEDAKALQEMLVKGSERFFEFSFYVTIPAQTLEELESLTKRIESTLGSLLIVGKVASLDMPRAFISTAPFARDLLYVNRNMDTTSLATTFPFTTAELSSDKGILYGINSQNDSFIIFDRFELENSNMTVFATSGAGKSFFVKLEAVRSLMLGTEIIVIDPENEYQAIAEAVGGEYLTFSASSESKINPFDLSQLRVEGEDQLGLKILTLHSLFKIIMGDIDATQEAMLDAALIDAYRAKGITRDPETQGNEPPLIEDLYKALIGKETDVALDLAARIEKFVKGSYTGVFDRHTNIDIKNPFTVFSVRDIEDAIRPIVMFVILDFIWTKVRRERKKRLLIVDEAWHMMRYEDSANFMLSIAKRARKYYLGLTTITQDVNDFLANEKGKAVVTNAAMRLLLKQSPAAIDQITDVFYLSQGERQLLLAADIGEGILFAGPHHAPIRVVASDEEYDFVTTNPRDLAKSKEKNPNQNKENNVRGPIDIIRQTD